MWILYGVLIGLGAALVLFLAILAIRAAVCGGRRTASDAPRQNVDAATLESFTRTLGEMIACETVADGNHADAFVRFRQVLKKHFPLLHARAELQVFGTGCLVYKITGKDAKKNIMLMSHHDVAAAEGAWKYPPFSGAVSDGALWGRGAVDTKTPLFAELAAVEGLLSEGYEFPGLNVYIGSSDNEEICGDGMPLAVRYFREQGIRFDAVFDEGGAVVSGMMPGVRRKSAMVAVHEKGRHIYRCTAKTSDKGHLGLNPALDNAVARMSAFICAVEKSKLCRRAFYPEVREMFVRHAPYMPFPLRLLFANFGLFAPLLLRLLPKLSRQAGAMLGTTYAFTSIEGAASGPQIQAKTVTATAFFRCVREETLGSEIAAFRTIADKYGIEIKEELRDYCRPSRSRQQPFGVLERTLNECFPDVIVSPFLLTAGTDARHFSDVADCILRFAPIDLDPQRFASVHNPDENIGVENVGECVCFYRRLLTNLAETGD